MAAGTVVAGWVAGLGAGTVGVGWGAAGTAAGTVAAGWVAVIPALVARLLL